MSNKQIRAEDIEIIHEPSNKNLNELLNEFHELDPYEVLETLMILWQIQRKLISN